MLIGSFTGGILAEIIERELSKPPIFRDEGKLSIDYVPDISLIGRGS